MLCACTPPASNPPERPNNNVIVSDVYIITRGIVRQLHEMLNTIITIGPVAHVCGEDSWELLCVRRDVLRVVRTAVITSVGHTCGADRWEKISEGTFEGLLRMHLMLLLLLLQTALIATVGHNRSQPASCAQILFLDVFEYFSDIAL